MRDRAWLAACAIHSHGGSIKCPVGEDTSEAVLAEVQTWLRERAEQIRKESFTLSVGVALSAIVDQLADEVTR
jgi:hypothetical protein